MDYKSIYNALEDIARNGDYSLTINGKSKHLNTDTQYNETNPGLGLIAERGNKFLGVGGYKNSYGDPSYYAGVGLKKRFGGDYYMDLGALAGVVSGYNKSVVPMALPMATFGKKGLGAINMMYAPKVQKNPAVLMFNLSVPFK